MPRRGEIWLADLNPPHSTEPGKTRPVLIIQTEVLLEVGHPSTYIIPLTTNLIADAEPMRIRVNADGQLLHDSDLLMDQLRAIDNRRLISGPLLRLTPPVMRQVAASIAELLEIQR